MFDCLCEATAVLQTAQLLIIGHWSVSSFFNKIFAMLREGSQKNQNISIFQKGGGVNPKVYI